MFIQMYEEKYMRFPEGKAKAITFSYDDGVDADVKLLAIFKKYNLKGTFNLNSKLFDCHCWHGKMNEEQTFETFKDCGQEIALHGARHIFMDKVPLPEAIKEVVDNRAYLEEKFDRIVNGMAYAYNGFNEDIKRVLKDLNVVYARTTKSTRTFDIPKDFLEWNPTCHHSDEKLGELAEKFVSENPADQLKHREPWLFYVWGHSFEFDDHNNWDIMENFAEKVSGKSDVWYATNMQIYSYIKAYNSLIFSCDGEIVLNPTSIPVWIEVRGKVYKILPSQQLRFDRA
jgi:peptidoglycan/xylan/chitin deacetylase (PgdA/CDA1 family)